MLHNRWFHGFGVCTSIMEVLDGSDHRPLEMHRHDVAQSTGQQFVEDGERDKRWQFKRLQSDAHRHCLPDHQCVTLDLGLTTRGVDFVLCGGDFSTRCRQFVFCEQNRTTSGTSSHKQALGAAAQRRSLIPNRQTTAPVTRVNVGTCRQQQRYAPVICSTYTNMQRRHAIQCTRRTTSFETHN